MPAHGWLFLATPGDLAGLHEEQSGFLFSDVVLPGEKAAIVSIASIHF
ncbi:hypothetical protein [Mesorhizobium sp. B2-8-5]|nr:hypothetical protein [Mesorhizobium sp. B2-8-5]UCI23790.1 hypothetical protein FJ430_19465 [Mesorhizobium sp. B2-8-5]